MENYDILLKILMAFGIGLLVGIERGWKLRALPEGQRVAGIRTFSLIGLLGGVVAYISTLTGPWILLVGASGIFLFALSVYLLSFTKTEFKGATTEVAVVITFFLSVLAVLGDAHVVLALTMVLLLVLGLKAPFHRVLERLNKTEIIAFFQMVILSVMVLPFLPDEGYGPGKVLNPFEIWLMVVLIQGISFFGYFAVRLWGQKAGTILMGVFGGLASTTALTFTAARLVKDRGISPALLTASVSAGNVIMFLRTLAILSVVNVGLVPVMAPPLLLGSLGALFGAWFWQKRAHRKAGFGKKSKDKFLGAPTNLVPAFTFALLLAGVLVLTFYAKIWFDVEGVWALAALSGLVDVDAITISLGKLAGEEGNTLQSQWLALGILLAIVSNSFSKTAMGFVLGSKEFGLKIVSIFAFALGGVALGLLGFWL